MQKIVLSSFGSYWLILVLGRKMWFDTVSQFPSIEACSVDDRFELGETEVLGIIDVVQLVVPDIETLRYINGRPHRHTTGKFLFCGILAFDS